MAEFFVIAGSAANTGAGTAGDPWIGVAGVQLAMDTATSSDSIYVMADATNVSDYVLAGALDNRSGAESDTSLNCNTNQGTTNGKFINMVGVGYNASPATSADYVDDGTRVVIHGSDSVSDCITITNIDYWSMRNFRFRNANASGVGIDNVAGCNNWQFVNCWFHDNGGDGLGEGAGSTKTFLWTNVWFCRSYNNTDMGFIGGTGSGFYYCAGYDNGDENFYTGQSGIAVNCFSQGSVGYGFYFAGLASTAIGCVMDSDTIGAFVTHDLIVAGSRLTNNTTGLGFHTAQIMGFYNYYSNNGTSVDYNDSNQAWIPILSGSDTFMSDSTEILGFGYQDRDNNDFATKSGTKGYRNVWNLTDDTTITITSGLDSKIPPKAGTDGGMG